MSSKRLAPVCSPETQLDSEQEDAAAIQGDALGQDTYGNQWAASLVPEPEPEVSLLLDGPEAPTEGTEPADPAVEGADPEVDGFLSDAAAMFRHASGASAEAASAGEKLRKADPAFAGHSFTAGAHLASLAELAGRHRRVFDGAAGTEGATAMAGGVRTSAESAVAAAGNVVMWRFEGQKGTYELDGRRGLVRPGIGKDLPSSLTRASEWLAKRAAEDGPLVAEVPTVRAWAESHVELAEEHEDWRPGWVIDATTSGQPLAGATGREYELKRAVLLDSPLPAWAVDALEKPEAKATAEITADDQGVEDIDRLDAIVDAIVAEVEGSTVYQDDDVVMEQLDSARTPAERDYVIRELRRRGVYDEMVEDLDGRESDEFDSFRNAAGDMRQDHGKARDMMDFGDALGMSAMLLPGAYASMQYGMVTGIPFVGDFVEAKVGDRFGAGIDAMNGAMGIDERTSAASRGIGTATGKVEAALGSMLLTGGASIAWNGADALNSGYQAITGEKTFSKVDENGVDVGKEKLSPIERIGAIIGAGGSAAGAASEGVKMAGAADLTGLRSAAMGPGLEPAQHLENLQDGAVALEKIRIGEGVGKVGDGLSHAGNAVKAADPFHKAATEEGDPLKQTLDAEEKVLTAIGGFVPK